MSTPWVGSEVEKLYLQSGQFTSTVRTSQYIGDVDTSSSGISYDGIDTPWCGAVGKKLYLQSGQFTSTLITSQSVNSIDITPGGISWDGTNTPWSGFVTGKLYLQSGQFTSTLRTSQYIGDIDSSLYGISYDGTNTPWVGYDEDKLYLQSGQFTTTLITSQYIGDIDINPTGISYNGTNTPWSGYTNSKLYLQSGQFSSTIVTSQSIGDVDSKLQDICTDDIDGRLGIEVYEKTETDTLILNQQLSKSKIRQQSITDTLTFNQAIFQTYERSITDTLTLSQGIIKCLIRQHSITDTLTLSQQISKSKIIQQSITDILIFNQQSYMGGGGAMNTNNTLTFAQEADYFKIEYLGINNWSRWIFASASKHFENTVRNNNLPFFIEGTHGKNETQKYIEFRMDGPNVTQLSHNYYRLDVEINILWSFNQGHEDFHMPERIKGILIQAMQNICVHRYGNDDSYLGTLQLKQDRKTAVRVNNFGQVRPDVRLMQGTVEGTYVMYLTT